MAYMPRIHFEEDYVTENINHFSTTQWLNYGDTKLGTGGTGLKLVGVRNWPGAGVESAWCKPKAFLYGKRCKVHIQQAMKDGFVELRFSYKPFKNGFMKY